MHLYWAKRKDGINGYKQRWLRGLIEDGKSPVVDIIHECIESELDQKEIEFIALYKSFGARLTNLTFGGKSTRGYKCSEATKEKLRTMFTGKCLRPPITEKERIALGNRSRGKKMPEDQKRKLSEQRKGSVGYWRDRPMAAKCIEAFSNAGKDKAKGVVAYKDGVQYYFASQVEAKRVTGCDRKSIRNVCDGIYKQDSGYFFMHAHKLKL